jgi:hypothetical protein
MYVFSQIGITRRRRKDVAVLTVGMEIEPIMKLVPASMFTCLKNTVR